MKFTDGQWILQPGVSAFYPAEVHDVATEGESLVIHAPTRPIKHRGDTLGGPLLTVTLSSPMEDVVRVRLEHDSRDTLQNLRNARQLLSADESTPAVLLSSRYHLARCALFARSLGISHQLCAAEDQLGWSVSNGLRLLSEAAYMMWVDVGARWARLIGHRRMLARIS